MHLDVLSRDGDSLRIGLPLTLVRALLSLHSARPLRVTSGGGYYNDDVTDEETFVPTTNKWRNPKMNHPTIFLFVAPPAAASVAARAADGGDGLADTLFFVSLFLLFLILANPRLQDQRLPFKLVSWVSEPTRSPGYI